MRIIKESENDNDVIKFFISMTYELLQVDKNNFFFIDYSYRRSARNSLSIRDTWKFLVFGFVTSGKLPPSLYYLKLESRYRPLRWHYALEI